MLPASDQPAVRGLSPLPFPPYRLAHVETLTLMKMCAAAQGAGREVPRTHSGQSLPSVCQSDHAGVLSPSGASVSSSQAPGDAGVVTSPASVLSPAMSVQERVAAVLSKGKDLQSRRASSSSGVRRPPLCHAVCVCAARGVRRPHSVRLTAAMSATVFF